MRALSAHRLGALLIAIAICSVAADDNSKRVESIASKIYCNCGCSEMLSECAHVQCKRKVVLKHEIADAVLKGDSDSVVLERLGAKYGATILSIPPFRGFNILLWLWPFAIVAITLAVILVRWKKSKTLQGQRR